MTGASRKELRLRAHVRLQAGLGAFRTGWSEAAIFFEFADPKALFAAADELPVLLPAASEPDRELVCSLRRCCCLTPILAVVNDISGQQTFLAIKSGATSVLNVRLPQEMQIDAVLTACSAAPRLLPSVPWPRRRATRDLSAAGGAGPEEAGRLVQLLCGTSNISSIAQQFYCSERSMYRRIRRLYEQLGVSGRAELRSRMATTPRLVHGM